ncbi:MAG: hypothetical protein JWN95_3244 [Frankiales bacterium]|nr:hypothetical protein [Frankiales bacterium]
MAASKVITVRLDSDLARRVEFVARVEDISVNDFFKRAVDSYLATLKADENFGARAKALLAQDKDTAKQLV